MSGTNSEMGLRPSRNFTWRSLSITKNNTQLFGHDRRPTNSGETLCVHSLSMLKLLLCHIRHVYLSASDRGKKPSNLHIPDLHARNPNANTRYLSHKIKVHTPQRWDMKHQHIVFFLPRFLSSNIIQGSLSKFDFFYNAAKRTWWSSIVNEYLKQGFYALLHQILMIIIIIITIIISCDYHYNHHYHYCYYIIIIIIIVIVIAIAIAIAISISISIIIIIIIIVLILSL